MAVSRRLYRFSPGDIATTTEHFQRAELVYDPDTNLLRVADGINDIDDISPVGPSSVEQSELSVEAATSAGGYNVVASPDVNVTDGTDVAVVFGGTDSFPHDVTNSALPVIGGGYGNKILNSIAGVVAGGAHHIIDAPAGHGGILSGSYQEVHGAYGTAVGGFTNKAESNYSAVVGGRSNIAGDAAQREVNMDQFVGGGFSNEAKGSRTVVGGGNNNQADAPLSTIAGGDGGLIQVAATGGAIGGGTNNMVSSSYGAIPGGSGARSRNYGEIAHAGGFFAANGDAQASTLVARCITTNAVQTEMGLDGAASRLVLPSDCTMTFSITIAARRTDVDDESAGYRYEGVIDRNGGVATTALVGTVTEVIIARDSAAWIVLVDANTINGSLRIRVTGEAAKTIRWVARIDLVTVIG